MTTKHKESTDGKVESPETIWMKAVLTPDDEHLPEMSNVAGDKIRPFAFMGMYSGATKDISQQLIDAQDRYNKVYIENYKNIHCVLKAPSDSYYNINGGEYDVYLPVDDKGEPIISDNIQDLINDKWVLTKYKIKFIKTIDTLTDTRFNIKEAILYADVWIKKYLRYRRGIGGDMLKNAVTLEQVRMETKQAQATGEEPDDWTRT